MERIYTYDTTLRDGEQCEGISLSLEDKLLIVRRLDEFGIDFIEGGFPASNPKDIAFFKAAASMPLSHARIAAFGSTCRKGVPASADEGLRDLLESQAQVLTIVGKTWDVQVTRALQTTLEENLRMIGESVAHLKAAGRYVVFDAEHYFDGFKANKKYALECISAAVEGGADSIDLCETNGGALPFEVEDIVSQTVAAFPDQQFGIHCHNDSGCAVANTLAAVRGGVRQVQGTVNGLGERVGNTDLLTVIADLELKMGIETVGLHNLKQLTNVSHYVAEVTNTNVPAHYPYSGTSAFAHKGGLHASAIARFPEAYEHISPNLVGNSTRMVVSELAGKASLMQKAASLGIDLEGSDIQAILDDIKERESRGYTYEVADGSLALLLMRHLGTYEPVFTLESFRVIVDDREDTGALAKDAASEATIKLHVPKGYGSGHGAGASGFTGDSGASGAPDAPAASGASGAPDVPAASEVVSRFVATGEGAGPVGALDNALRMALAESFPEIGDMHLVDYKVRLLDESQGTDAITRVIITTADQFGMYGTVGVSENVIEASWNALVESVEYGLIRLRTAAA